jgi:hypothetical protein
MTVSANSSLDYTRDQLLTSAFQLAAVYPAGSTILPEDVDAAATFMNLELFALQAELPILRTEERTTLTLVAGTAEYSLPSDVIDVPVGPNDHVGTIVPSSGGENIVLAMSRQEYLDISDKSTTTTGRPVRCYVEKTSPLKVVLWPAPDSTSVSLRYTKVRLLKDLDTGAVTVDLARRWLKYITYAVASEIALAKSMPLDRVAFLRSEAERRKALCKADDIQRGKIRMRIGHNTRRW